MKLAKISCQTSSNWALRSIELGHLNLVVAKNATGKSRTISTIDSLVKYITQKWGMKLNSEWDIEFINHRNDTLRFEFSTKSSREGIITNEKITINERVVLHRNPETGSVRLRNELRNEEETIFPPENKLTLHVNRDIKKYPYLEEIVHWAEHAFGFKFGNIAPQAKLNQKEYDLLTGVEEVPVLFDTLEKSSREKVIDLFNSVGYDIEDLKIEDQFGGPTLFIKERELNITIPHFRLSQGMYRTLSIVIYLEYLISKQEPAMVIIDDLCEGLDYERATKLGKLVFDLCKDSDIQLIATSNDSFLMDVVDIKYWNILQRNGGIVTAINVKNSAEKFRDFKFTGLSNFDFFASDYLEQAK